ncbi:hypothetical protein C5167_029701 [Papaver somniferum]|nr:hypothetical protein C5167_029701 [Papaver somniferum]
MLYESFAESFGVKWLGAKEDVACRIKESFCYLTFLTPCIEGDEQSRLSDESIFACHRDLDFGMYA